MHRVPPLAQVYAPIAHVNCKARVPGKMERTTPDVNTDVSLVVAIDAAARQWEPSPSDTVWRKSFYREGGETGPVTSLVRYDAHSSFARHEHPDGEEIFVLEGVFSDEHGDYPAGSFLLNPPGFAHSPRSEAGCKLFVHLRQYGGPGRRHIALDTSSLTWTPSDRANISRRQLYAEDRFPESICLEQWAPGAKVTLGSGVAVIEIFVLSGTLTSPLGVHGSESWIRAPARSAWLDLSAPDGCTLYVRTTN
ncbi:MAG: cupin domain-containing protein [Betaproteobacteria bacterium]